MGRGRVGLIVAGLAVALVLLACQPVPIRPGPLGGDRVRAILPPGNYGGLPTTINSRDQLRLYDGLTPKRGNVTDADIDRYFLPEDFQPVGPTRDEPTGRPGTTVRYDAYGIPHVTGRTREDLAFGAGWVTARDRGLLLQLGRGPSRVAVADVPGIDAFGLVTSGQSFVPSAATEQLVTDQVDLIRRTYGARGEEMLAEMQAEADGMTAYFRAHGDTRPAATVNDVIAVTAFIGSIFGAGGGAEASNAEYLSRLQNHLGVDTGQKAWNDTMLFGDPEAPTTLHRRFDYGAFTGGRVTGSAVIDEGSIVSLDPRDPPFLGPDAEAGAPAAAASTLAAVPPPAPAATSAPADESTSSTSSSSTSSTTSTSTTSTTTPTIASNPPSIASEPSTGPAAVPPVTSPTYPAAGAVPHKQASNFLVVDPRRSANGNTLAVMGPQLGYYYPEIVQQIHLSGPGIEAQGVGVPAAMMYVLIGRTPDYAWSLTSANHDVRDVFVEELCNPDGSPPTAASNHYRFEGECRPFETFDAGTLNGTPLRYPVSVHGPVIGTATSEGRPVVLTRKRSTFGRDGLNLMALKDMTDGKATSPGSFFGIANQFGFTFNWAYANRHSTAYFTSGLLPRRARGLDRRLPTLGTGDYEWRGFLNLGEHPHGVGSAEGLLLNWNNQAAPGFMHGDDNPYGSVHRVELFDQFPADVTLADDVSVMNRAATEDARSPVWPVISRVLEGGPAPSPLAARVVALLDDWVRRDAPRLDADNSGKYDEAGPGVMDALWTPLATAVMQPVFGDQLDALSRARGLGGLAAESYVDKDLRTALGEPVRGPFALRYCGAGSLDACRASLWAAVDEVASTLAAEQGTDPSAWREDARRTSFTPGLISDTIRATNRPTFQQVIELAGRPDR